MHQTTVRFGTDLWEEIDREAAALGVSVAQFVREAALARLMYLAGRRGDRAYERALELSEGEPGAAETPEVAALQGTFGRSASGMADSAALWAQGQQARRRAHQLRDQVVRRRREP
jgi:hypothetical protein